MGARRGSVGNTRAGLFALFTAGLAAVASWLERSDAAEKGTAAMLRACAAHPAAGYQARSAARWPQADAIGAEGIRLR